MQIATCYGWRAPTVLGTSDYFNVCHSTTYLVGIPQNALGYQFSYSGNGYCGFIGHLLSDAVPDGHYTEYIQGHLLLPLTMNNSYHFTAYISLADGSAMALDQLGAYFSTTPISRSDHKPFSLTPQVLLSSGGFLSDTMNWTKLEGDFKACGGEQYITIGNFRDTLSVDTLRIVPYDPTVPDFTAYYYIDNISLTENESPDIANCFTPNEDGQNDFFIIQNLESNDKVVIFNRWGIKIYEFSGRGDGWNGSTAGGEKCSEGVYYYIVTKQKEKGAQKGFIQLIR
jgi:gliding motility-associated-like protein